MAFAAQYEMTIGGEPRPGALQFDVVNPATGAVFARAPSCGLEELDGVVAAARAAFPGWRDTPWEVRGAALVQLGGAIRAHLEPLMRLLTAEQGKPHAEAEGELLKAAEWLDAVATLRLPSSGDAAAPGRSSWSRHVPLGVVGAIAPWNYPVALAVWKIAPALLAGNTVVLKPSPYTPLTTLRIGELARGIFPPGVLNVISGTDALGPWMTAADGIDKISFTGSTHTGRAVMAGAAPTLKRLTLELGGNDAAIVMPDVDVGAVAERLFWAAFRNAGQVCIASKRLFIHDAIYDDLAGRLAELARAVRVGDGARQGVQMGPVQNAAQYRRLTALLAETRASNARLLAGEVPTPGEGYFMAPVLVDNPSDEARVVCEEQFGPIVPLLRFRSADEAIARANQGPYGLGASIWCADPDKAERMAAKLEAGSIWINEPPQTSPHRPFGGHKQSGLGVENGLMGLMAYTNVQTVSSGSL